MEPSPADNGGFGLRERIALFTVTSSAGLLTTGLVYPVYSCITRWRAHHVPLSSSSKESGNGLTALWNLSKAFYQNHGWRGLYRGLGTSLLTWSTVLCTNLVAKRILSNVKLGFEIEETPTLRGRLVLFAGCLVALPLEILAHRMVIYGGKVGKLITVDEQSSPLSHIYTPSLILSGCAAVLVDASCFFIESYLGTLSTLGKSSRTATLLRPAVLAVVNTVFNVIFARLSASPLAHVSQHSVTNAGRPNVEYYHGFLDCVQRLVREEGIGSLFRGWYIEVAAAVFQASTDLL